MKVHSGVDAESGLIHSVVCTATHEADVVHVHELLHGQESQVHGDNGYTGLEKRGEIEASQEGGRLCEDIDLRLAMKRGQLQAMPKGPAKALHEWCERRKAQARAIVEHPFRIITNRFAYREVSYRSIAKNQAGARTQAALVNLHFTRRRLIAQGVRASAA